MAVACHPGNCSPEYFGLTLTDSVFAEEMEEVPREHSFIRCERWIQHRKCLKVFETENLLNLQENFTRSTRARAKVAADAVYTSKVVFV